MSLECKKPDWLRVKSPTSDVFKGTQEVVRKLRLHTICEEAACPNIGKCWGQKHAAFLILGDVCTRHCAFCNVKKGTPCAVDPTEPRRLALSVAELGLKHVVITSVTRDDLADGGAGQFVKCINEIRERSPETSVEILTPDFLKQPSAAKMIADAHPDVFNHNVETVPRLYRSVRFGANYFHSLSLLQKMKDLKPSIFTKSGFMLGLGEKKEEAMQVMEDMRAASVDFIVIGQYLQPSKRHAKLVRYVPPEEFKFYENYAKKIGFLMVSATPLARSSFHADEDFKKLKANRLLQCQDQH